MVSTTHKNGKFGEDPIALLTLDRNSQMLKDLLKGSETKSEINNSVDSMVRLTNGTARTHPFSKSVGICWKLISLFETDTAVDPERTNEELDTPSPIAWDYEGYLGFHPPCNIFTQGCAIPVGTSMCSATIVTSACVKDVHLCIYIHISIHHICNITAKHLDLPALVGGHLRMC